MEVSRNGMKMFAAGSYDEGTKFFLGIGNNEKMNDGNGRGTFNNRWKHVILG